MSEKDSSPEDTRSAGALLPGRHWTLPLGLLLDRPAKDLCLRARFWWHSIDLDASLTALWLYALPVLIHVPFPALWPCLFWENLKFSSILHPSERNHLHSSCDAVDLEGMDHEVISGLCNTTGDLYWVNIHVTSFEHHLSMKLSFQGSDPQPTAWVTLDLYLAVLDRRISHRLQYWGLNLNCLVTSEASVIHQRGNTL